MIHGIRALEFSPLYFPVFFPRVSSPESPPELLAVPARCHLKPLCHMHAVLLLRVVPEPQMPRSQFASRVAAAYESACEPQIPNKPSMPQIIEPTLYVHASHKFQYARRVVCPAEPLEPKINLFDLFLFF